MCVCAFFVFHVFMSYVPTFRAVFRRMEPDVEDQEAGGLREGDDQGGGERFGVHARGGRRSSVAGGAESPGEHAR